MGTEAQKLTLVQKIQLCCDIVVRQRRIPGKCYHAVYRSLHAAGFKTLRINVGRGVRLRGFTSCLSMAQEVWSKRVYDHPGFTLGKDMRVIDIGANQGFFSTYAASFGARVYAFEPSSENFEMLQRNLSENACGSLVTPFRVAVAGKRGRMTLYVGLDSKREILSGTASITNTNRGGVDVKDESVEATTLDDILHENDIAFCDFLKMDCEGAEYEILQSTSAEAFNRIGRLSMETHEGRGREAVHLLRARGYEIMEFEDRQAGILKARRSAISR